LKIHIDHLTILITSPPQIMLFALDLDEDFIDVEGIALPSVLPLQAAGINCSKLDAPKANCFAADRDTSFD